MNRKKERTYLREKTNGRCGYCGCELKERFHVDHINPIYRGWSDKRLKEQGLVRGSDGIENKIASCPRCNRWKATFSLEKFRTQVEMQHERLYRNSAGYRLAFDMGIIKPVGDEVIFYFETLPKEDEQNT